MYGKSGCARQIRRPGVLSFWTRISWIQAERDGHKHNAAEHLPRQRCILQGSHPIKHSPCYFPRRAPASESARIQRVIGVGKICLWPSWFDSSSEKLRCVPWSCYPLGACSWPGASVRISLLQRCVYLMMCTCADPLGCVLSCLLIAF